MPKKPIDADKLIAALRDLKERVAVLDADQQKAMAVIHLFRTVAR